MYSFYLAGVLLPVTPSKLKIKINGQNKTLNLIDGREINFLKRAGLSDIQFEVLLPQVQYPFAVYASGFKPADYYLGLFEKLKQERKPFRFIVSRELPDGSRLFDTGTDDNFKVSLEDYQIDEDAGDGFDVRVQVKLKQYQDYGTKIVTIEETAAGEAVATVEEQRETSSAPDNENYTVVAGDSLWNIAQKSYGDGERYPEIYAANQALFDSANEGTGNPRYTIYPGQVLVIPR